MLEFPRWKYLLVLGVTLLGLVFAFPNFLGEDYALQVVRKDRAPIDTYQQQTITAALAQRGVKVSGSSVDQDRLVLRFAASADQYKARDAVNEQFTADYSSALSYAPRGPDWLRTVGLRPMPLGLDLRGGLYLLYQVDVNGAVSQLLDSYEQGFRRTLTSDKIDFSDIQTFTSEGSVPNALRVVLPAGADAEAAREALRKANSDLTFTSGTRDGAPTIEMALTTAQIRTRQDYAIEKNRTTLTNRVNALGVSEPTVQRQGLDRINVQLPGVQNSAEVKDILGKVATLEFHMQDQTNSAVEAEQRGRAPLGSKLYKMQGQPLLLKRELIASGDQLTDAQAVTVTEGPAVSIKLNSAAADAMLRNTQKNLGKHMAIVYIEKSRVTTEVDGKKVDKDVTEEKVISNATIQGVFSSQFQITGLSSAESRELALLLRAGSLSAPIYVVDERAIGPSLGQENINKGIMALVIGMGAVFLFMLLYYQVFGLVANLVLLANVVLLTALLSMLRASLSLPGIAGIILTVGIAVDANVLIYERIREEVRNGVSPQAAIRAGFEKAYSAIFDSNVTAFIAGLVLWVIGRGAIRGFAVVLTLGIATSMFTSLLGSRALISLIYGGRGKTKRLLIG